MLQHTNKKQLIFVGKASEIKQALASIKNHDKYNQTLQHYLLQRPTMSIKIVVNQG